MTGPGDDRVAGHGRGRGDLRSSHADRERVVEVLKAAFVQGRLDKGELDARVGRALASRTYAELAALTADIPAGPTLASPRQPARARDRAPMNKNVRDVAIGLVVGLGLAAALVFSGLLTAVALLGLLALPILLVVVPYVVLNAVATSSQQRRSRGQLPPRPGQGGQPPEVQRPWQPGQAGHHPALPPDRPNPTRADLRARISWSHRSPSSGRAARAPRAIRPVPDTM
jgi:Domain of unknown function (DUF1707)